MRKNIKYLASILTFLIVILCSVYKVNAWEEVGFNYFITELNFTGTTLQIKGYAYEINKQDYLPGNHSYYLVIKGADSGKEFIYNLDNDNNISVDLSINGYNSPCGETGEYDAHCRRMATSVGFKGALHLEKYNNKNGILDEFSSDSETKYYVWLGIKEHKSGRDLRQQIKTFPAIITGDQSSEYRNTYFDLNKTKYSSKFRVGYSGVIAKDNPDGNIIWSYNVGLGYKASGNSNARNKMYIGTSTFGNGDFIYAGHSRDSSGVYWLKTYGNPSSSIIDTTYGGNYTLQPRDSAGGTTFWVSTSRTVTLGENVYFTKHKNQYADVVDLTVKMAKPGDNAIIEASYNNSKANSPIEWQLLVDGSIKESGVVQNETGIKNFTFSIPATQTTRKIEFLIKESYTGIVHKLPAVTLYPSENKQTTKISETGCITPSNPILGTVAGKNGTVHYYKEKICFNNPQNYVLTEGDYKGSNIYRETSLTYTSETNMYGEVNKYFSGVTNTVSNSSINKRPTNDSNKVIQSNLISTKDTLYVEFRDLSPNNYIETTYTGVGVNNYTIILKSNYEFENDSAIKYIDAYTTEKTENSKIIIDVFNSKTRNVKWKIYFNDELIKEGQDAWNQHKLLDLNEFIINKNGNILIEITEPNGVRLKLRGNTYVADEKNITLTNGETYTSTTPIRVTTPYSGAIKSYFETISLDVKDDNQIVKAGEGVINNITLNYISDSQDIILNNDEISAITVMPNQVKNLDYTQDATGVYVPLDTTLEEDNKRILEFPNVKVERKEGTLFRENDPRSNGLDLIDGTRHWFTSFTENEGKYNYTTTLNHVGVNATNIKYYNSYTVKGSVIGEQNSKYKVIRVQNPSNPVFTYHKTYTLKELLEEFGKE